VLIIIIIITIIIIAKDLFIVIIIITSIDDIGTDDRHSLLALKSELKWK